MPAKGNSADRVAYRMQTHLLVRLATRPEETWTVRWRTGCADTRRRSPLRQSRAEMPLKCSARIQKYLDFILIITLQFRTGKMQRGRPKYSNSDPISERQQKRMKCATHYGPSSPWSAPRASESVVWIVRVRIIA